MYCSTMSAETSELSVPILQKQRTRNMTSLENKFISGGNLLRILIVAGYGSKAQTALSCWCSTGGFSLGEVAACCARNTPLLPTPQPVWLRPQRRDETGCACHILSERLLRGGEQQLRGGQGRCKVDCTHRPCRAPSTSTYVGCCPASHQPKLRTQPDFPLYRSLLSHNLKPVSVCTA